MKTFAQYEHQKTNLLHAYDLLLKGGLLPVEQTGLAEVEQRRKDLEEDRFLVAICGRIKTGKSTLLNALLFRDWVVPTDDVPLTAKNTLLEYGPTASLEITFYNSSEWRALTDEVRAGEPDTAAKFFNEVQQAEAHGVKASDLVHAESLTQHFEGLSTLARFVTPVAKGGLYMPFVKQVRVKHPHPWLRSVTIADTPGVDDPFSFREDQTKKFVTGAGAVLYVTYAGQAMAQQDFDFLNTYLIHVAPSRRVLAVNKADTLKRGGDEVTHYLDSLAESPEPAVRAVFGDRGSVRLVSALGALLSEAVEHGRELSEDNQYYRDVFAASGFLKAEKHGIDALRELIEARLVTHDGQSRLEGHAQFVSSLFGRKLGLHRRELSHNKERLRELGQSEQELHVEIGELEKQMTLMKTTLKSTKKKLTQKRDHLFKNLQAAFDRAWETTATKVRAELDECSRLDRLGNVASWSFSKHFADERVGVETALTTCVAGIETSLKDFEEDLRSTWATWGGAAYLDEVLSYSLYDTLQSLHNKAVNVGSEKRLEQVRHENTLFYQRWFNTANGRYAAVIALVQELRDGLSEAMKAETTEVKRQLTAEIQAQLDNVTAQLHDVQQRKLAELQQLVQRRVDRVAEREKVATESATLEADLRRFEALQVSVQSVLTV